MFLFKSSSFVKCCSNFRKATVCYPEHQWISFTFLELHCGEGRDKWKFFTCHWIKVSPGSTVARAREMLTLLAVHSDTINCLQQASLDLNKSSQRWPQGRSSRNDRTWWSWLWPSHMEGQLKGQRPKTSDAALEECRTATKWTEKVSVPSTVPELY